MTNWNVQNKGLRLFVAAIAAILLLFALSPVLAGNVAAQEPATATTDNRLNLREGPGLEYEIIEVLDTGEEVTFTGRVDLSGDWLEVETDEGTVGWVAGRFLSRTPDPDTLELWVIADSSDDDVDDDSDEAEDSDDDIGALEGDFSSAVVTAETLFNLNIRNAPNLSATILDTLPAGTTVGFTGFTDATGEWVQIDAIGYPVGWVAAAFLSNVPNGLQVAPAFASSAEAEDVDDDASSEDEDVEDDSSSELVATTLANLNLREAPSLEADILDTLPAGTEVIFTGLIDESGQWVQVEVDGLTGWVASVFLSDVPVDLEIWEGDSDSG